MQYTVSNIKLPFDAGSDAVVNEAEQRLRRAGIDTREMSLCISKRSIDARNKDSILQVCSVTALSYEQQVKADPNRLKKFGITVTDSTNPSEKSIAKTECGAQNLKAPPLVVGMGPAGLFCALMLAENGYDPILIERGDCVKERVASVNNFYHTLSLDVESNIQFGEGGAGTFSDGKLVTRIHDPLCSYVLHKLCEAGAPEDILVNAKPHVGTDLLRSVVTALSQRIREHGGRTVYRCRLDGIKENADGTLTAKTTQGDIVCGAIVLAIGHSARDTYVMLRDSGYQLIPKPFSMGVRIEHLQEDIDRALFGKYAGHPALGKGEYNLSDTRTERGVYTFCMCPGGEIVAATSESGSVVVNGMSNRARDGKNANCAVCVSVGGEDVKAYMQSLGKYNDPVSAAITFQRMTESRAFIAGGSDYSAPIQLVGSFLGTSSGNEPVRIRPTYMGGDHVKCTSLDSVLPPFITASLKYGISSFDRKIKGFAASDAVLSAVESRTTAPLRIVRDDNLCAVGHDKVYPCGEGAGYAGGITSAAVDGIRCAAEIIRRFRACGADPNA